MKTVSSFFLTCIGSTVMSILISFILFILYLDISFAKFDEVAILILQLILIISFPVSFLVLYLPIYLYNKAIFQEKNIHWLYHRYLFIALIPVVIVVIICSRLILQEPEIRIFVLNQLFSTLAGFYIFIKTIK